MWVLLSNEIPRILCSLRTFGHICEIALSSYIYEQMLSFVVVLACNLQWNINAYSQGGNKKQKKLLSAHLLQQLEWNFTVGDLLKIRMINMEDIMFNGLTQNLQQ